MPRLIDDWSQIIIPPDIASTHSTAVSAILATFQSDLVALSSEIDGLNKTRKKPFLAMSPRVMESSVSI
jgi:hypothetical protein